MAQIIYDFAQRKQQMEADGKRVQAQVGEAVQQERMRLAYERGRVDERQEWLPRRLRGRLVIAALVVGWAFTAGWALAVSGAL